LDLRVEDTLWAKLRPEEIRDLVAFMIWPTVSKFPPKFPRA